MVPFHTFGDGFDGVTLRRDAPVLAVAALPISVRPYSAAASATPASSARQAAPNHGEGWELGVG